MEYLRLTADNICDYVRKAGVFFEAGAKFKAEELSDGNINFVFRVLDEVSGKSVIIKQAAPTLRSNPNQHLSQDRINFEMDSLQIMHEVCPGSVPLVYLADKDMKCFWMEDLRSYSILRSRLMKYETFPFLGDGLAKYMARLHYFTSDFYMNPEEKKAKVSHFINPELCEITERLVYTEPFTDYLHRNTLPEELKDYVEKAVYQDEELKAAAAVQKYKFMTNAQALLHGDIHTGSIFIREDDFKAFDTEFAFYGPCAYDLGCIVGNLLFSYLHALETEGPEEFKKWVIDCAQEFMDAYVRYFRELALSEQTDRMLRTPAFVDAFLQEVIDDTLAVAGVEMLRRTIAVAKVAEIKELPEEKIPEARRKAIDAGRKLLLNPKSWNHRLEVLFAE